MPIKEPENMDELVYFTNRAIGSKGQGFAKCWVYKKLCAKCGKAFMGKPVGKDGHVKIRAKEYQCPACKIIVEKQAYEDTLFAQAKYTCPSCEKTGEDEIPYKRKKYDGIETLRFKCKSCGGNVDVTKKLKSKGDPDEE